MKAKVVFAMVMGILTTGIISVILIYINMGFKPGFVAIWLRSWGMAYVIVIPVILIIGPVVQRIVNDIFEEKIHLDIEKQKD